MNKETRELFTKSQQVVREATKKNEKRNKELTLAKNISAIELIIIITLIISILVK